MPKNKLKEITLHVDQLTPNECVGWASESNHPFKKFKLLINGALQRTQIKTELRPDVEFANAGPRDSGYRIRFRKSLKDGDILDFLSEDGRSIKKIVYRNAINKKTEKQVRTILLFEISDLLYYLADNLHLTGIQRVQASILLSVLEQNLDSEIEIYLIAYCTINSAYQILDEIEILHILKRKIKHRDQIESESETKNLLRQGRTADVRSLNDYIDATVKSSVIVLGAAWAEEGVSLKLRNLKRDYGCRIILTVHDLIPIYAEETCDQTTVEAYKLFLQRSLKYVDEFYCVSQSTYDDLLRYSASIGATVKARVVRNGSNFDEFLDEKVEIKPEFWFQKPFVLYVSTLEKRKNHQFALRVWRRLLGEYGNKTPFLVLVGKIGWKVEKLLSDLIEENWLDNNVIYLNDVSDLQLKWLYENCLFTIFPSLYEGWGLPVGEALSSKKICVTGKNSSLTEVGGDAATYIDYENFERSLQTIAGLIVDDKKRKELELNVRERYKIRSWKSVALEYINAASDHAQEKFARDYEQIELGVEYPLNVLKEKLNYPIGPEAFSELRQVFKGILLPRRSLKRRDAVTGLELRSGVLWGKPENLGCWALYPDLCIGFRLSKNETRTILLVISGYLNPLLRDEFITVSVNNLFVDRFKASEFSDKYSLRIPSSFLKLDENNLLVRVKFSFKWRSEIVDILAKEDKRLCGIFVRSVLCFPEDDFTLRTELADV